MNARVAYSFHDQAWRIYLVPSMKKGDAYLRATHGERFDPVERQKVTGGLPMLWGCAPGFYPSKKAAEKAAEGVVS